MQERNDHKFDKIVVKFRSFIFKVLRDIQKNYSELLKRTQICILLTKICCSQVKIVP